ncbi:MAG: peptidylprolyl isomerase [Candidatus Thalassarchaeaceae archaeon]|nr:peptidylprolyl isomerase [Candidatus Thalassarchaeaceae archaeon]
MTEISKDTVASVHYTGTFPDSGEMFDTSREGDPLVFLVGHKGMIPGFEREIMGSTVGETRSFTLEPEDAYGHPTDEMVQEVPRAMFPEEMPLDLGMMLMSDAGPFRIVAITDEVVKCDFNNPMAGKTLHFEVEVMEVRAATEDELAHGHAHGPGGHHHHEGEQDKSENDCCGDTNCC